MKKTIIHQFDPVLYPVKLWVAITNNSKALNDRFIWQYDDSDIDINFNISNAVTGLARQRSNDLVGVLIVFESYKQCTISNIAHEASHAVDDVWNRIGEKKVGQEANAYLIGWIADCIEQVKLNKFK